MKKFLLIVGATIFSTGAVMAQHDHSNHDGHNHGDVKTLSSAGAITADSKPATTLTVENLQFTSEMHDFGTVPEGPAAEYEFVFKNTGKEPINLQTVTASCGCTTPSWSKEPVLPGKTGTIKASFATERRPGGFNKSITVVSNAGTKVLTIKGNVEPAPTGSVPTTTKSMIQK